MGIARGMAQGQAQGMKQGMAQGMTRGADEQARRATINLYGMGMKPEDIARALDRPEGLVRQWLEMVQS
jgi:DNA-directed RNA polymerase specialized sigma24 family protein